MSDPHPVRLVDLLAPLSLVTDLGIGQPAEDAMRASEEAAYRLRAQGAEVAGESFVSVERYEVAFSEVSPPAA